MRVLLTGATGLIGSAVLRALREAGDEVVAVVRSEKSAEAARAAGAVAALGDVADRAWLVEQLRGCDAAIHTASPMDATSREFDMNVIDAVLEAFAGTSKSFVHTGGVWLFGETPNFDETSTPSPPPIVAWRVETEAYLFEKAASAGIRVALVAPGVVYDADAIERGIPGAIAAGQPRDEATGGLLMIGSGEQRWVAVSTADIADLYVRVLRRPDSCKRTYFIGVSSNPTVRELYEAASRRLGITAAPVPTTPEQTKARFGEYFAQALLMSAAAGPTTAAFELGWKPASKTFVEAMAGGK